MDYDRHNTREMLHTTVMFSFADSSGDRSYSRRDLVNTCIRSLRDSLPHDKGYTIGRKNISGTSIIEFGVFHEGISDDDTRIGKLVESCVEENLGKYRRKGSSSHTTTSRIIRRRSA